MERDLAFWLAYARAVIILFLVLVALNWLAYIAWSSWLEWWALLGLAAVIPGMGLIITWDEI